MRQVTTPFRPRGTVLPVRTWGRKPLFPDIGSDFPQILVGQCKRWHQAQDFDSVLKNGPLQRRIFAKPDTRSRKWSLFSANRLWRRCTSHMGDANGGSRAGLWHASQTANFSFPAAAGVLGARGSEANGLLCSISRSFSRMPDKVEQHRNHQETAYNDHYKVVVLELK